MMQYSIVEAKNGLPQLVREAEAGSDVQLTRRGKLVAVVIGTRRYEELTSGRPSFWDCYQRFRQEHDLAELDVDPTEVFAAVRDDSPGREFSW